MVRQEEHAKATFIKLSLFHERDRYGALLSCLLVERDVLAEDVVDEVTPPPRAPNNKKAVPWKP